MSEYLRFIGANWEAVILLLLIVIAAVAAIVGLCRPYSADDSYLTVRDGEIVTDVLEKRDGGAR